ncbi:unnamed protein product [Triticum turgidum subsp. durum]|uniref:NLP1-9 GAF domain-containing protein n=1 Tax=Triticum turgidum subsp. durum TaxID=4567 RepID=A0A9R0XVH9_TRITD|nr:unnamed protein product [Triticum turgidum subsp. durum]
MDVGDDGQVGEECVVLEFFLPPDCRSAGEQKAMVDAVAATIRKECSGDHLEATSDLQDLSLENVLADADTAHELNDRGDYDTNDSDEEDGDQAGGVHGADQSGAEDRGPPPETKKKKIGRKAGRPVSLKELQGYFSGSLKDAARSLGAATHIEKPKYLLHDEATESLKLLFYSVPDDNEAHLQAARHIKMAIPEDQQGEPCTRQDQGHRIGGLLTEADCCFFFHLSPSSSPSSAMAVKCSRRRHLLPRLKPRSSTSHQNHNAQVLAVAQQWRGGGAGDHQGELQRGHHQVQGAMLRRRSSSKGGGGQEAGPRCRRLRHQVPRRRP